MENFFSPSKTAKLYETWEGFKESMRKCPHHIIPEWLQVQIFYNGLNYLTRQMIDAAASGILNHKTLEDSLILYEDLATNNYEYSHARDKEKRTVGVPRSGCGYHNYVQS